MVEDSVVLLFAFKYLPFFLIGVPFMFAVEPLIIDYDDHRKIPFMSKR